MKKGTAFDSIREREKNGPKEVASMAGEGGGRGGSSRRWEKRGEGGCHSPQVELLRGRKTSRTLKSSSDHEEREKAETSCQTRRAEKGKKTPFSCASGRREDRNHVRKRKNLLVAAGGGKKREGGFIRSQKDEEGGFNQKGTQKASVMYLAFRRKREREGERLTCCDASKKKKREGGILFWEKKKSKWPPEGG